jgi:hypothetical protein
MDISCKMIATCVGEKFNVTQAAIYSPSRIKKIATARHISLWLARHMTAKSLPEIGRNFGGRDHTSVLSSLRLVENWICDLPRMRNDLVELEAIILAACQACLKLGIDAPKDIDAVAVAKRVLGSPMRRFMVSEDEMAAMAYALVTTAPATSGLHCAAQEAIAAFVQYKTKQFDGARRRFECAFSAFKTQFEEKETQR